MASSGGQGPRQPLSPARLAHRQTVQRAPKGSPAKESDGSTSDDGDRIDPMGRSTMQPPNCFSGVHLLVSHWGAGQRPATSVGTLPSLVQSRRPVHPIMHPRLGLLAASQSRSCSSLERSPLFPCFPVRIHPAQPHPPPGPRSCGIKYSRMLCTLSSGAMAWPGGTPRRASRHPSSPHLQYVPVGL